jgi:PAS domain S-box-containing protein
MKMHRDIINTSSGVLIERHELRPIYLMGGKTLLTEEIIEAMARANFQLSFFAKSDDLKRACEQEMPIAVIVDNTFIDESDDEISIMANCTADIKVCPPVIQISKCDDFETRLASARAGISRFFSYPVDIEKFIQTLNELQDQIRINPYRVLFIDDEEAMLDFYSAVLSDTAMIVKTLSDPLQGLKILGEFDPDIIVMDINMPGCLGTELAQVIRQDDAWAQVPIIFLSAEDDLGRQLMTMNLGGDFFLTKPVDAKYLVSAIYARVKRARQIHQLNNNLQDVLRENKYQLATMYQHDLVSSTDVSGRIISVNDNFCEISGYSAEELLGQNHRILKSGFHPSSFYKDMWDSISTGKIWRGSICNRNKSGGEYWVESTIVPFLDSNGKPYKYVSARTDTTALRKSEERLNRSQEFANIGTWDWNVVTGDLFWSERIWPLFGYDREVTETTYENFMNAVHPDDRQKVTDAVSDCVEKGSEYNVEHRIVWGDGSVHWVQESGNVLRDEKGKALHMLGVVQDINIRKHVELQLSENKRQLVEAQSLASIGSWQADMTSGELVWSDEVYRVFGYEPGSFKPSVEAFVNAIHPDDREQVIQSEERAKKTGQHNVVHRILLSDGSIRHVHELAQVEIDDQGNLLHMTGTVQDITEQVNTEQALLNSIEEAENANRAKSQFLSSMSHELRTPLNAIMGFSQLLKMEQLNESQDENVREITKAGSHLLELINEVLDLAKIEAGRIELSIETIIVEEIISESLQLIMPLAQKRNIEINLEKNGKDISFDEMMSNQTGVHADHSRLRQVFLNLLSNAVKYNYEDGKIIFGYQCTENNTIRISITDSGPGLDQDQQAQLFKAFNRLGAEQSEIEGSGIGLVITKNITELMGGNIGVSSEKDKGSTFWIELASKDLQSSVANALDESIAKTETELNMKHEYTVLYIEDNPANLRLVNQLLSRRSNIHVWSAPEPLLGLELAVEHKPDLILLDINLPGMNGYEVLKQLKNSTVTSGIPVIAISANAMPKDIEKGREAGFDNYVTKPIDVMNLLNIVDASLSESKG